MLRVFSVFLLFVFATKAQEECMANCLLSDASCDTQIEELLASELQPSSYTDCEDAGTTCTEYTELCVVDTSGTYSCETTDTDCLDAVESCSDQCLTTTSAGTTASGDTTTTSDGTTASGETTTTSDGTTATGDTTTTASDGTTASGETTTTTATGETTSATTEGTTSPTISGLMTMPTDTTTASGETTTTSAGTTASGDTTASAGSTASGATTTAGTGDTTKKSDGCATDTTTAKSDGCDTDDTDATDATTVSGGATDATDASATTAEGDTDAAAGEGSDFHDWCCWWASEGECEVNPYFMRPVCQKSCGTVGCRVEKAADCKVSVYTTGCKWLNGPKTSQFEPESRGEHPVPTAPESVPFGDPKQGSGTCTEDNTSCAGWAKMGECDKNPFWMKIHCQKSCNSCGDTYVTIFGNLVYTRTCKDFADLCPFWAWAGECDNNRNYMRAMCRAACKVC